MSTTTLYEATPQTGTVSTTNLTSLYSNTTNFTSGVVNSSVYSVNGGTGVTVDPTTGNVLVSIGQDVATTANVTFANVTATGNLSNNYFTLANSAGTNGQVLVTNGAGATAWTSLSSIGVTSITGTTNQIIASSATGAVTLSTPQDIATTSTPTFAGATLGNVTVGVVDDNTIATTTGNLILGNSADGTYYPVINSGAANPVFIQRFTSATNANTRSLALNVQSTGTPTVGFGNALEFQIEAQPGNTERAGSVSVISTDLTAGSEDFKMSFALMRAGGTNTERAYLDSLGNFRAVGYVSGEYFDIDGGGTLDKTNQTTSSTAPNQVVGLFTDAATYRSLKWQVQITCGTEYQALEIMMVHDGSTVFLNTYGDVRTGTNLATFTADISGGLIRLLATPTYATLTTYTSIVTAILLV